MIVQLGGPAHMNVHCTMYMHKYQSWEYQIKFGISVFGYYRWYFQIPKYRIKYRYRYRYRMDDTEWFFGIFEFSAPTKNLHNMYICLIGATVTILAMHDKCCLCRLEIAVNCCVTRSFCLHFHHWRIDPSNTGTGAGHTVCEILR